MFLLYESWKRNLANPLFYFISIGAGLIFTVFFSVFNPTTAIKVSCIAFLSIIFFSLLLAFIMKDRQDVIEIARRVDDKGKHKLALRILVKARKRARDDELRMKINYEIGTVYCSMEQYPQAVNTLSEILKNDDTEWMWKVYFQLAKALCHTKGFFSNEVLEAYLGCVKYRKKTDVYGRGDLREDIYLCNEISEIYRVKKNSVASNTWFREEMVLREANCNIITKNKIKDLFERASVLANESHIEDALRLYEEAAHLIEEHISVNCDKYAMVQLEMGKLYWKGYAVPRYELALECFQKSIEIKRKYMSDMSKEFSGLFTYALPDIQELCRKSMDEIRGLYRRFQEKRNSCNERSAYYIQSLLDLRNRVIDKCEETLALAEEVFSEDSLELAEIYRHIGESYKWFPCSYEECALAATYLEKVAKIWRKYKNNKSIQIQLARLLVDIGGTFGIQRDYETELSYRLEAFKIIKSVENADLETIGNIELSLKGTYEKSIQSKTVEYNTFLENNGLSTVIESVQVQPLGNGWGNFKVKIRGSDEEYNWKMTLGGHIE